MIMKRRLACCTRDMRDMSIDYDEQERVVTYNGLESCILNSNSFDNESGTSRGDACATDSFDDDDSSCSSSANAFGSSFSSLWPAMKKDDQCSDEWSFIETPQKEKPHPKHTISCLSDVETMKEKFAKLLLGDDVTGGAKGVSSALALSNAINNLAASVFGELWKLEPLPEERKSRWQREMDWFLAPTNYMVELVPAKLNSADGRTLEIMTPRARADIHMNLPALRKLDSMLIETLESMVNTEFWYTEVGNGAEGRSRESVAWWLPSPRVPAVGLSEMERKRLLHQGKMIYQVFKAAKSINENVLAEMPIPAAISRALPKSEKACLGEELYKVLSSECEDMMSCLNLKSEQGAIEAVNRLEAAVVAEKGNGNGNGKSPMMESVVKQAELLRQQLKNKYPNLPQTFLDVTKIQYCKDVGHSILEAYSRVLANLALSILSRLGDIFQEDIMSNPNSPAAMSHLIGARILGMSDSPLLDRVRHSLIHQLNGVDVKSRETTNVSDADEAKISSMSVMSSPSRSQG